MQMLGKKVLTVLMAGPAVLLPGRRACAQLVTNMNFNQEVQATYTGVGNIVVATTPVVSTSTSINQTVSANDANGCLTTANYIVTDSALSATISINASGSLNSYNNDYAEFTIAPSMTSFKLSQPATYIFTATSTGFGQINFDAVYGFSNFADYSGSDQTVTMQGVLMPGPLISFADGWTTGNVNNLDTIPESGTYSLSLTFTAIPEPSSAALIAVPAIFALSRRRRLQNEHLRTSLINNE